MDANGKILYKEFTIGKEMVDVVAIPLKDTLGNIKFYPVDYTNFPDSLLLRPTDRLFVLGFPLGQNSDPFFPIWKSGLIASEPSADQGNKPIIWLDLDSFKGMSGSPVYYMSNFINYNSGFRLSNGNFSYFLGVFSHKLDNPDIKIGALWKASYLKKLFNSLP